MAEFSEAKRDKVRPILKELLKGIDDDTLEYFENMVIDGGSFDESTIKETLAPFIESYGLTADLDSAELLCIELCKKLGNIGIKSENRVSDEPQLLNKATSLSEKVKSAFSVTEQAAIEAAWGFADIRSKKNDTIETTESGSAKFERKMTKKLLGDLDSKFAAEHEDEESQLSIMTLPDFSGNNREKDIQVNNVTITYGGSMLLDGADIRLVYGRRYGLVGRNGVGKTTLLKHMASFDIDGFPRHHRILHVKQEVKASPRSVLEVVLDADVERAQLLATQKSLVERQQLEQQPGAADLQNILDELAEVHERLSLIGADSAESRAAAILSGLQFSEDMQRATTDSLSGGWLMRVALASALLIEPDVLMLDEPTNHLDLDAVLWLQNYLLTYPHTVLLVSHDRAFLNEVCTDVILFKNLKLHYFRGNYDAFEKAREEALLVQQRQHESQQAKIDHMQEFVDKFRYNAKRASLVQSRIKAIARESVVELEEEDAVFQFSFPDCGSLGNSVIQINGATFGYGTTPLFRDVHLGLEQTSRVALVGPNGCGKSTLLNLIRGKLRATDGVINVNPQLRLGIFTQHHLDSFDLLLSPIQNMLTRWPKALEQELRAHLGRYEITGDDALKPMKFSSGGQKSRVAFACLTFAKPHVVLLDEPTNHLDMGAIGALIGALKAFGGGVLVISHDQHFITSVCSEIWVVGDGKVSIFRGSFDDYKRQTISRLKKVGGATAAGQKTR